MAVACGSAVTKRNAICSEALPTTEGTSSTRLQDETNVENRRISEINSLRIVRNLIYLAAIVLVDVGTNVGVSVGMGVSV